MFFQKLIFLLLDLLLGVLLVVLTFALGPAILKVVWDLGSGLARLSSRRGSLVWAWLFSQRRSGLRAELGDSQGRLLLGLWFWLSCFRAGAVVCGRG